MPITLFESAKGEERGTKPPRTSIAPGVVQNNCDLIAQGKVLVRLPSLNQEVWARLTAIGAGKGSGHFHPPNIGDEVLVALVHGDPVDAYVLGGMWSTASPPPISPVPTDVQGKRVMRTGVLPGVGHEIVFDDVLLSITITTSMSPAGQQKIKMDPTGITLQNLAGTISISMDNVSQTIKLEALNTIELNAGVSIKLEAPLIDIGADGPCVITGSPVELN